MPSAKLGKTAIHVKLTLNTSVNDDYLQNGPRFTIDGRF